MCHFRGKFQAFPGKRHPRPHQDTLLRLRASLSHLGASINAVLSMYVTPRPPPISPSFYYFDMPKHAKDVLGRPDCGVRTVGIVSASLIDPITPQTCHCSTP